jgi:hypothetical protein
VFINFHSFLKNIPKMRQPKRKKWDFAEDISIVMLLRLLVASYFRVSQIKKGGARIVSALDGYFFH